MERIQELSLSSLTEEERAFYLSQIPEEFLPSLEYLFQSLALQRNSAELKAFVAFEGFKPLSVALVKIVSVFRLAELEFLYTFPEVRNRGIAARLLAYAEEVLRDTYNILIFQALYPEKEEWSEAAVKLFEKLGWKRMHKPLILDLFFDVPSFRPDWMYHTKPLPKGEWDFFLWKDLTDEEEYQIQFNLHHRIISRSISPFRGPLPIHQETSIGLRHKGKLIGWSITHSIDPKTLRYSTLYVDPAYQYRGPGVQLLIATLRAHDPLREIYPHAFCEVILDQVPDSWVNFLKRKVFSHAKKVRYRYKVWKQLNE